MERSLEPHEKEAILALYENRYRVYGRSFQTVGWGSTADQLLRFEMLCRGLSLKGKSILDVGCGLGDFVPYLDALLEGDYTYTGIDLSPVLVEDCRNTFADHKNVDFLVCDVLELTGLEVDVALVSGALNYRIDDNIGYTKRVINHMYRHTREAVATNFLSSYVDFQVGRNYHHSPEELFSYAKTVTRWVTLYHDYPLWEFTLQLHHCPLVQGKDSRHDRG